MTAIITLDGVRLIEQEEVIVYPDAGRFKAKVLSIKDKIVKLAKKCYSVTKEKVSRFLTRHPLVKKIVQAILTALAVGLGLFIYMALIMIAVYGVVFFILFLMEGMFLAALLSLMVSGFGFIAAVAFLDTVFSKF